MKEKVLSVFIDESGDFRQFNPVSPEHTIHTGPLIRRESV